MHGSPRAGTIFGTLNANSSPARLFPQATQQKNSKNSRLDIACRSVSAVMAKRDRNCPYMVLSPGRDLTGPSGKAVECRNSRPASPKSLARQRIRQHSKKGVCITLWIDCETSPSDVT